MILKPHFLINSSQTNNFDFTGRGAPYNWQQDSLRPLYSERLKVKKDRWVDCVSLIPQLRNSDEAQMYFDSIKHLATIGARDPMDAEPESQQ